MYQFTCLPSQHIFQFIKKRINYLKVNKPMKCRYRIAYTLDSCLLFAILLQLISLFFSCDSSFSAIYMYCLRSVVYDGYYRLWKLIKAKQKMSVLIVLSFTKRDLRIIWVICFTLDTSLYHTLSVGSRGVSQ